MTKVVVLLSDSASVPVDDAKSPSAVGAVVVGWVAGDGVDGGGVGVGPDGSSVVGSLLVGSEVVGVMVGGGVGSAVVVGGGDRAGVGAPGTPGHPIKGAAASAPHWQHIPSSADPKKAVVLP